MAASQQVKDDFLAALNAYGTFLQLKIDAAEQSEQGAGTHASAANDALLQVNGLFDQTVTKAAEAVASALMSYNWANKAEDTEVTTGEYSAYHHRRKAEIAAQQVLTALAGYTVFKGQWNATGNTFPTGASSGWMYRINGSGTLTFEDAGTKLVSIGDYILKTDTGWTYIDEATDSVKSSRTINGKALDVNIVLTPADVSAVAIADLATQAIAEAGTDDTKWMSSLKTRKALEKMGIGLTAAPNAISNIDAFDTPTGMYRTATGTTGTFPNTNVSNFTLIVTRVSATAVNQILIYIDGHMWVRGSSGSVWGAWKGATPQQYGIGGAMPGTPTLDLNDLRTGGIWITDNVAAVNIPTGWPQARYSVIVGGSETYTTQIITNMSSTSGIDVARMAVRRMRNLGTWSNWFEIWNSNSLVKQTSAIDATAGSMLSVGAGGLLGYAPAWSNTDATTINVTGFFRCVTGMTGIPADVLTGSIIANYQYDNDDQYQEIFHRDSDVRYYRRRRAGTWWPWLKMFHSGSPISDHPELSAKLDTLSLQAAMAL